MPKRPRYLSNSMGVLPNIRGGIFAAFILGFSTSFNEVPVSQRDAALYRHQVIGADYLRSLGVI